MNIGNGYNSAIGNPAFNKNSYNTQTASTLQNGTGSQFYHNPNFTTNTLSNQNNSLLAFNTNTLNNNALNTNALNTNSNIHNANSSAVNPFNTNVFNTNPGSNMPFNSNGVNPNLVLNYPQMNLGQSMPHMNLPTQGLVINDELLCQQ